MAAILQSTGAPTQADFHAAISDRSDRWFSACLKITRNRDLAEDAVQDALLSAWNKRHQFDSSARLDTWIQPESVQAEQELGRDLSAALTHLTEIERVSTSSNGGLRK